MVEMKAEACREARIKSIMMLIGQFSADYFVIEKQQIGTGS